jgi:hypothetical protein
MLNNLTRSKAIQIWFAVVALILAATLTFGSALALTTWALILGLTLVPAILLFALWPGEPKQSMKDMVYTSTRER